MSEPASRRAESRHVEIEWIGGANGLDGANVHIAPGVIVELATVGQWDAESTTEWGVWGIRIDGQLYREPRDLTPEPLADGPFKDFIKQAEIDHAD